MPRIWPPGFAMFLRKLSVFIALMVALVIYIVVFNITQSAFYTVLTVAIVLIVWIGTLILMLRSLKRQ